MNAQISDIACGQAYRKSGVAFIGSEKEHNSFGASSSDSEDEARVEMQSSSRRPSYTSNYRPEFAAKTLAQVWDCQQLLCNLSSCCCCC